MAGDQIFEQKIYAHPYDYFNVTLNYSKTQCVKESYWIARGYKEIIMSIC